MMKFTDEELAVLRNIAEPLSAFQRGLYLARLAENLSGCTPPYGDGAIHRAAVAARAQVLMQRRSA
jgi:hypothetical protein